MLEKPQCLTSGEEGQPASQVHAPPPPPRSLHGWKWALAYTSMLSTTFLFALDNTIVADMQASIISDLGTPQLQPWIGTGFALGTMTMLFWGKVYGLFNLKWVYIATLILFDVGAVICGTATDMSVFIFGRVVAGVGGAGTYVGAIAYTSISTSTVEMPLYLAGHSLVWGIGSVIGPLIGGAFIDSSATWRWGFFINLVICAIFVPVYVLVIESCDPKPQKSFLTKLAAIDWPMTITYLGGSTCLILAMTSGGLIYPFNSWQMILLWTMTGILAIATVVVAKVHPLVRKEDRLYPVHFLTKPVLLNVQVQMFVITGIVLALIYYVPLYFQFVKGDSALTAGVRILPLVCFQVTLALVCGAFMPRLKHFGPWYIGGSALLVIGVSLMCTITSSTPAQNIYGYLILAGTGGGAYLTAGFCAAQSLVPCTEAGNVVAAMTNSQVLGIVFMVALSGSVFQNVVLERLHRVLPNVSADDISRLIAGTSSEAFARLSLADQASVIQEIVPSLRNVWLLIAVAAACSFVLSLFLAKARLGGGPQ